ncbi:transporter substrate-binding domain-containing protein [Marinomonas spartinae]|uniref:transporter substrate-binding domain-containing protein n=1 Tax=Marinomonas spartinae TaxID=1792290 RepID=UPI0018F1B0E1|nr:transporter substrate-binding domain-containing protein [Marinomonas spartinae]MBJ7557002.1 transporter substrate-binding domain-containing protein [Marinomonas spartinae]
MQKSLIANSLKIALFSLAAAITSAAVQADVLSDVKAKGELVIGTEFQFAPFDFLQNGKHEGLNKDFFTEVGKALGVKVKYIDLPWPSVLPGLDAKKFDMVGGPVTITKARMMRYDFTLPIADASVALLKKAGNKEISSPEDIAGKPVGAGKGSSQATQLENFSKTLKKPVQVKLYIDNNQAYSEIMTGRVVAVANSLPNIAYMARHHKNFAVVMPPFGKKTYYAYVTRKGADSASLLKAVNGVIIKMENDGRMRALQEKWFGVPMKLPQKPVDPQI